MVEKPLIEPLNSKVDAVRRVLAQLEDFRGDKHEVVAFGEGSDNETCLVDNKWVFRFAKHVSASEKAEAEIRLLPHLRKVMPVPVPEVSYAGLQENGNYFFGYKLIEGDPLSRELLERLSPENRAHVLDTISRLCRALIDFPLETAREAKVRTMSMELRHEKILAEWQASPVSASVSSEDRLAIEHAFRTYLSRGLDTGFAPSLINTDLSCNHILMNATGTDIAGIIDWSDTAIGDPHYLFPRLWIDLGEETAAEIIRSSLPDANMERIKFYVLARSLRSAVRDEKEGKEETARTHLARAKVLARVLVE